MSKRVIYLVAIGIVLVLLWLWLRSCAGGSGGKFEATKFEQSRDRLVKHNANFLRRDSGGARYKLTLTGERGYTCFAALRLPMTDRKLPGLVLLNTLATDTAFFAALSALPRQNEFAAVGLNINTCFGSPAAEALSVFGAAELCVDYLRRHNAVDTNQVFVAGLELGALYVLPVALLEKDDVRAAAIHATNLGDVSGVLAAAAAWATPLIHDSVLVVAADGGLSWWEKRIGALPEHAFTRDMTGGTREALVTISDWVLGPPRPAADTVAVRPDQIDPAYVKKLKMN